MNSYETLIQYVNNNYPDYYIVPIKAEDIVFEEKVRMNCFYCGKYNTSWKCPPRMPELDYKKMISEFDNIALVYSKYYYNDTNYNLIRSDSSVELHKTLLELEKFLWENNNSTALSFIGGSCKLCKNGCGKEHCNNPYKARSPMEATGMNVVKTAEKYNIKITFPPKDYIIRMGMILW